MAFSKYNVAVVGGAGYTGGELLRLLVNHPAVNLTDVLSRSQAGKPLYASHLDLLGETELRFAGELSETPDVLFLCLGHGESANWLQANPQPEDTLVIDLSQDFRLGGRDGFLYALPEANRDAIAGRNRIANPGCFATAIQLGLMPLAANGWLTGAVNINATTGATGAGQSLSPTSHFAWRTDNLSVYKAFTHQHLGEIRENLGRLQTGHRIPEFSFIPQRGAFARGILAAMVVEVEKPADAIREAYERYYEPHPFTHVLHNGTPDMKAVVNTNKCFIGLEQHGNQLLVVSVIDNLLKGASGQAVQNMNLALALPEDLGIRLKGVGF